LGDTSEDVSSSDRDCGASGLIRIKLELDFHCRGRWRGPRGVI
jgi:hypothetical protein